MRRAIALPLLALPLVAGGGAPDPDAPPAIQASLERMREAAAELRGASYTLHRSEWRDGVAYPPQVIATKLRRPEDLYMRWVGEAYQGREALYRAGRNDGRLKVSEGAYLPTLDLDPTGSVAMLRSRHPVWMGSVLRTATTILGGADTLTADPTLDACYEDQGTVLVRGEPSHCYQADLPVDRDPGQYAPRVLVCMSLEHGLPTRFAAWERAGEGLRMVEDYGFEGLVVNPGLSDVDFDPDNPAYGF
jgi:hypothetical protein